VALLNMPIIKGNPHRFPVPLYKYLTDSKLRDQYKKYKICEPYTSKETCSSQSSCKWVNFWFDGMEKVEEYCLAK
jgi:hypothetical protein